jgi:hypothetical protein
MTVTEVRYPVAPTTERRRGTLLDAATVETGIAWHDGLDLFPSYGCMKFDQTAAFCAAAAKTLDQAAGWQDGFRFAAYGGTRCKTVSHDEGLRDGLRTAFERGESAAVEKALMTTLFKVNDATATLPGEWPAATDITPAGGAVSPKLAVALMEEHAASTYVGVPTLHLPVSVASLILAVDGAEFDGDTLRTKTGSKVAAGAGYMPSTSPAGAAAAAGERWAYVTGEVLVMRGDVIDKDAVDTANNEIIAMVERGYIAAIDCFRAAIRVNTAL